MKLTLPKFGGSSKSLQYGERLNPARDWAILVSIAALLLLASIAWNIWLFYRVTSGDAIGAATVSPSLSPASTGSVDALFQKRADTETEYKNAHFVDPSSPAS
ncbi:MAG TPA: hypothetical protein VGN56_02920 [Candidatus Paceibacterota bacterium]|jgi:hypothetical protein|nr:hypothetical protein [Candidatus Paceibacterota bacterium]